MCVMKACRSSLFIFREDGKSQKLPHIRKEMELEKMEGLSYNNAITKE